MDTNIIKTPYEDPTKMVINSPSDVRSATLQLYAQFNRWWQDHDYPRGLRVDSLLVNKLMYYTEKEIQRTHPKFRIDTGWYLYGPCYEAGRMYEVDRHPISVVPLTDRASAEVGTVCEELVPRFAELWKKGGFGVVLRDFLGFIYSNKCDHEDLKEYYVAKHGLQCQLWMFRDVFSELDPTQQADAVTRAITNFDKILLGEYPETVGLDEESVNNVLEFTPLLEEYARMVAEGTGRRPLLELIDHEAGLILNGLAHLNYAHTFQSWNPNHQANVRKRHRNAAGERIKMIPVENQRVYDGYGTTLRAGA